MEENETMEGQDLAQEEKKEEQNRLLKVIENLKAGQTTISTEGLEVTNYGGLYTLKMRGITFGTFGKDGKPRYFNLTELKRILADEGIELESLDLPDLELAIDQEELGQKEDNKLKKEETQGEEIEEEKGDETPELEEEEEKEKEEKDEKKEAFARQYGIDASQVIHISKNKKITKEDFGQVATWSREYDHIFIYKEEDGYSRKFIGVKNGQEEEIEFDKKMIGGKNPRDIKIKLLGEQITEVSPEIMYEIDNTTAIAFIRDNYGKQQAICCRQAGGDKKSFIGNPIPEASGNHVEQPGLDERRVLSNINSTYDLGEIGDQIEKQADFEGRGAPSDEQGVQVKEAVRGEKQRIEDFAEELRRRDSTVKEISRPEGYYEYIAKKVLEKMEDDVQLDFDDAVDKVMNEKYREPGGVTPGEKIDRRSE